LLGSGLDIRSALDRPGLVMINMLLSKPKSARRKAMGSDFIAVCVRVGCARVKVAIGLDYHGRGIPDALTEQPKLSCGL
jgi:hypothetical protein